MYKHQLQNRGFSLIEAVIVSAISVLVFGAIFASFQYSLRLINVSRAKLSAISVANDRMEYFRSLPYDNVGVISGFPAGTIAQNSTTTLNGIDFAEKVRVLYVDDPADGIEGADSNGITTDYKQIRLEYKWEMGGVAGEITMISNIAPRSIETNVGGGTVRVNVLDESSQLLPGASVRVTNATNGYDVTSVTDVNGTALFSVAADSNYEVEVTGPISGKEYSVDKTYEATAGLPNPVKAPFTVIEADISTLTFQIGELSDLTLALKSDVVDNRQIEEFSDLAGLASTSKVMSSGSALTLDETAGVYETTGQAFVSVSPATLTSWQAIRVVGGMPNDTSYRIYLLTGAGAGPYTLIPDGDLPGNSVGFSDLVIDISSLDPATYPSLIVGLVLDTSNTAITPSIDEMAVLYRESEVLLANEDFSIHGSKVIGTDPILEPVYKYSQNVTTDGSGEVALGLVEFDAYQIEFSNAYDIAESCPAYPISHLAGIASDVEIVVAPDEDNPLRVSVFDDFGIALPGVELSLTRPGYNSTKFTGQCGQAYFPGVSSIELDFELTITASGYQPQTISDIVIDGDTSLRVDLVAL